MIKYSNQQERDSTEESGISKLKITIDLSATGKATFYEKRAAVYHW